MSVSAQGFTQSFIETKEIVSSVGARRPAPLVASQASGTTMAAALWPASFAPRFDGSSISA